MPVATETAEHEQQASAAADQARRRRLRRFNWLAVYLPLLAAVLLLGTLFVLLTISAFSPAPEAARRQASGLADFWLIMTVLCPLSLICGIFPGLGVGMLVWRRRRGSMLNDRVAGGMHRLSSLLDILQTYLEKAQLRIAAAIIAVRSRIAWLLRFVRRFFS